MDIGHAAAKRETLAELLGDAEHVADNGNRQAEGETLDQVHMATIDDRIPRLTIS